MIWYDSQLFLYCRHAAAKTAVSIHIYYFSTSFCLHTCASRSSVGRSYPTGHVNFWAAVTYASSIHSVKRAFHFYKLASSDKQFHDFSPILHFFLLASINSLSWRWWRYRHYNNNTSSASSPGHRRLIPLQSRVREVPKTVRDRLLHAWLILIFRRRHYYRQLLATLSLWYIDWDYFRYRALFSHSARDRRAIDYFRYISFSVLPANWWSKMMIDDAIADTLIYARRLLRPAFNIAQCIIYRKLQRERDDL